MSQGIVGMNQEQRSFTGELTDKYLRRYIADMDWGDATAKVWNKYRNQYSDTRALEEMRKTLACAILIGSTDGASVPDEPYKLLFWVPKWDQYSERDWVTMFWEIVDEDIEIEKWRSSALSLGVIYPVEFSPITRQAYNWLYSKAEDNGCITKDTKASIKKNCENLVLAYGGRVISNVFNKTKNIDKKVFNWRTNYFFERLIYSTYSIDQIINIKKQELSKTNPKLVKKIKIS